MNEINNLDEKRKKRKQKMALVVYFVAFLAIVFCASYFVTDYFTKENKNQITNNEETNKTVYNENNKYLKDSLFVTLKTGEEIDCADEFLKVKQKLDIKKDITKEELTNLLSDKGYKLEEDNVDRLLYSRESSKGTKFEANKYYLGESEGYLMIFKTDDSGKIIDTEKKVYINSKPLSNLPEVDQSKIKGYKFIFDTKEDALFKLSEMIS